jgi:hypothetical protein
VICNDFFPFWKLIGMCKQNLKILYVNTTSHASFEGPVQLEFSLVLSAFSGAFYHLFILTMQLPLVIALNHVFRQIWFKIWVEVFKPRSTLPFQIQHDMRLSTVLVVVFCIRRPSSQRSVVCTR